MRGDIPHSPNTPSWRGAQFKHKDNFTSTSYYSSRISQTCYILNGLLVMFIILSCTVQLRKALS
jgi:hypothetical protein